MKTKTIPIRVIACGCCDHYHQVEWDGDCREDSQRFADPQDAAARLGVPVVEVWEDGSVSGCIDYPDGTFDSKP